jgi:hypothetical protein
MIALVGCFLLISSVACFNQSTSPFTDCLHQCHSHNCSQSNDGVVVYVNQPFYLRLLGWTCLHECRYGCMWRVIDMEKKSKSDNYTELKYYGKWPFKRILGMQEVTSALASLFHLAANIYMFQELCKRFTVKTPLKNVWYSFVLVSINAWFWSFLFHIKDNTFTEKMDYFSAFAVVLLKLNLFFIRLFHDFKWKEVEEVTWLIHWSSGVYFLYHIYYMCSVEFDYGSNMKVNLMLGLVDSLFWIAWSVYYLVEKGRQHAVTCVFVTTLMTALALLEIYDFPPVLGLVDAHALWHWTTLVFPFYWYKFVIDDCNYLKSKRVDNLNLKII